MRILVVDDSKTSRYVFMKMLNELGYDNLNEAESGRSALEIVSKVKPDLIFSDWNMPDISGIEFLRALRADPQTRDIPFVMVTTEKEQSKIAEAMKSGLQAYLLKPVLKKTLCVKLLSMAGTYNFPLPVLNPDSGRAVVAGGTATGSDPVKSILCGLDNKDLDRFIERCMQGFSDENVEWVAKEVFHSTVEEKGGDIQRLLSSLKSSAVEAIRVRLR